MTDETSCPECGSAIPADAPGGACPKCLMKQGLPDQAPTRTAHGGPRFAPPSPEELAGRFSEIEVLELIGHGAVRGPARRHPDPEVANQLDPPHRRPEDGRDERRQHDHEERVADRVIAVAGLEAHVEVTDQQRPEAVADQGADRAGKRGRARAHRDRGQALGGRQHRRRVR